MDKYVEARAKELEIRALLKRVGEEFAGGEREAGEFWRYENNVCVWFSRSFSLIKTR